MGHRLPRASSGSTATTTSTTPTPTSSARTATSATASCAWTRTSRGAPTTSATRVYAFLLMMFFEWGVALHDLEVENIVAGKRKLEDNKPLLPGPDPQDPQPGAQGLPAVPGADRPAVPADPGRQRDRQPGPQHLGLQHHLLRPLPGRRRDVLPGGVRGRDPRPLVLPPAARLGQHHRRQAVPRDDRQPVATRSSTTCSRTCRPAATRRSPVEVQEICERYGLQYNTGPLAQAAVQRGREDLPDGAAGPQAAARPARRL